MKLVDFIAEDAFAPQLATTTKREAIAELLNVLVERGDVSADHVDACLEALMARESLGSTGLGRGVGVPHAMHAGIEKLVGAIGLSTTGIDFRALDGQPVDMLFLILSPPDCPDRLEALKVVAKFVSEPDMCRFLRNAKDGRSVQELLHEAQARL